MEIRLSSILKVLIIIVLVIMAIVVLLAIFIQVPRYWRLKSRDVLFQLDDDYAFKKSCRQISKEPVVISLSTIPDRIKLIGPTLASLLDQTIRVDEIAINIPHISRKGIPYKIPKWLTKLPSVKIYRVDKDEGPGTKLLPTLRRETPSTRIIVVDDDNIYNPRMVEHLLERFEESNCPDRNKFRQGKVNVAITNYGFHLHPCGQLPEMGERIRAIFADAEAVDLLQGFSGFIVTPAFFPPEAYEITNCPKEAISVDDIWFTGWLKKNHVRIESSGCIYQQVPIINFGKMRETTSLAHGENKDFVTDQIVIDWFMKEHGFRPVKAHPAH